MERPFRFVQEEYYHVFNRGVEKRDIFRDPHDWRRFHELLYLCNSKKSLVFKSIDGHPFEWDRGESITSIVAYTMMPNHFHLILREGKEGGISKMVAKLTTSYSMYFNTKYDRSGPLLCRPFRARHITDDDYFRWVMSYVHLNPIKNSKSEIQRLRTYTYSSYTDYYIERRQATRILEMEKLPFNPKDLEDFDDMTKTLSDFQGESLE